MADFKYNPETDKLEYVGTGYDGAPEADADPNVAVATPPDPLERTYYDPVQGQNEALAARQQANANAVVANAGDDRPLFAQDGGQFRGDLWKSFVNPVWALATDYVDLGHGLVDVAQQTGNLIQGKGFDTSKVFDDSDNPLTKGRIDAFRSETQAGQFVNTTARVGVALLTLPKLALKGLFMPLKLLGKAPAVGKPFAKAGSLLNKVDDAIKAPRETTKATTTALNAIQKGAPASNVAKLANADDWLKLTYKDVVNAGVDGNRFATAMRSTERAAKSLTKGKASLRTVGEALAWDAFVAFNAAGEGNPMLDETFTDFLNEAGLPTIPFLQTSIRDTGLEAKFKQMTDGLLLGGIISSVMDVGRIYRFSRAFQKADDVEKRLIVKALNEEGERLGGSVARLSEQVDAVALLPSAGRTTANNNYQLLDMELDRVENVRANNQLTEETQANILKAEQTSQAAQVANQATDIVPSPGGQLAPEGGPIEPVSVQVMRPPEPTITPQTMRAGFKQYVEARFAEQSPEFLQELVDTTKRLMPRNRVDAIDMLERFPLRYNGLGMMEASDSVTNNYLVERGLSEGWVTVNPEMMELTYNRKLAFDFDRNQYAVKQARALDEAAEIDRYNAKMLEAGSDPATQPVQDELGRMGARDAFDESPTGKSTLGDDASVDDAILDQDQALVEARRQEQLAAVQEAGAKNAEQAQVDVDAIAAYADIGSDRQVVAEMLNLDLDALPKYQIEKIGNRRYQVLDDIGESVDGNTYSTLKAARKGAEIAEKAQYKGYVAKARALADRATDQPIRSTFGTELLDSPLVRGSLKLTQRQSEILGELGIPIEGTDLDLSQADLAGMSKSIQQLMEESTGPQRRVLGNILKRVDEKVTELAPAARLAAEVDKTVALSQKFLKDGEICF
jgi:hypothetical protein